MSLRQDLKRCVIDGQTVVDVPQDIVRRCRNVLINSPRDDQENEFLLENFNGRDDVVKIDSSIVLHMVDFLRGEME